MSTPEPVCMECGAALPAGYLSLVCARCLWAGGSAEAPAAPETGAVGMRVPGHEVIEELARGGMGVVYRARERESQRTVALKMLRPRLADERGMRERFRQEARAVAALDHPGILPVYRVDETDDLPFFTMKLAGGGTLAARLGQYAGQWREIAGLLVSLCSAVQYAHQHGVLHRDLKPLNVLFDDSGKAYLTDFGLAKLVDSVGELTGSLTYLGTPHYSAPEVASQNAAAATVASDVWSLGATLYELLAGRVPFDAEGVPALLRKIVEDAPPPLPAGVPRDLAVVTLKCLSKQPEQRYQSAAALGEDLQNWLDGKPVAARPVSRTEKALAWMRRNPLPSALAAALAVASVVAGVALVRENQASRAAQQTSEDHARSAQRQQAAALLAEARSKRLAGNFLERDSAVAAVLRAWDLEHSPEARDEYVSLLALPGVRATGSEERDSAFRGWDVRPDDSLTKGVVIIKEGCRVYRLGTNETISVVPDFPDARPGSNWPPGPLSPDAGLLVLQKSDGVAIWRTSQPPSLLMTLPPHWGPQIFSGDGRWLLSAGLGNTPPPRLCDLGSIPPAVREFTDIPADWQALSLSPDARHLLIGRRRASGLRLVECASLRTVLEFAVPAKLAVKEIRWSRTSDYFIAACHSGHTVCWRREEPEAQWVLAAHSGTVFPPVLFNDESCMATTGTDGHTKLWNLSVFQQAGALPLKGFNLYGAGDGRRLLVDDRENGRLLFYECLPAVTATSVQLPPSVVDNAYIAGTASIFPSEDGQGFIACSGYDVHLLSDGGAAVAGTMLTGCNEALAMDEAGGRLFRRMGVQMQVTPWDAGGVHAALEAAGQSADEVQRLRRRAGLRLTIPAPDRTAMPPPALTAAGSRLEWEPVTRRLLNGGANGFILWQMPERGLGGKRVHLSKPGLDPKAAVTALAWAPGGRAIAWAGSRPAANDAAARRRGVWIIDAESGAEICAPFAGETAGALRFSGDGSRVLAVTAERILCADAISGQACWELKHQRPGTGRDAFLPAMAAAPGRAMAAVTLEKESTSLVDLHTGRVELTLRHPAARPVAALAFSKDGKRLATVAGHFVQTWNLEVIEAELRGRGMRAGER